ncbi:MAG: SusC/RagA family TonB-linked outer membrane protein [Bacteroidota bacterium]
MKKFLLLSWLAISWLGHQAVAQDRTVTGKVISADDNSPLPGVSVVIKGTNNGTATGADGTYSLKAPDNATLVFSFIGLLSQEIPLGNQTVVDVRMQSDLKQLGEVIVTAVGISRDKKSLGYATTNISSEDLLQGQNTNPINALQGKVAGLNINSGTNGPGNASRIVLRGPTSFTGSNQPLFVIDGIPVSNSNFRNTGTDGTENTLDNQVDYGNRGSDINPQEIESITVLKGPAAAALYGSLASNGAIMITTKKGQKSKMTITLNSNITFSNILKLPDFQNQYGQGDVDNVYNDFRENFSWGLPFDGQLRPWGQVIDNKQKIKPYSALPNNVKEFFDTGKTYNNTLSLSGGNEKSTYFLSLTSQNNTGVVPTSTYEKYGVRFNGSSQFSQKISSAISLNYTNINSKPLSGGQGDAFYNQIIQTPRDISLVDLKNMDDRYTGVFTDDAGKDYYGYYGAYTKNPYFIFDKYKNNNKVDRITGSFSLSYKPVEGLDITERLGADIYSDRRYQRFAKFDYAPFDPFYDPNGNTNHWTYNGRYAEDLYNFNLLNHDLIASYTRKITPDFGVKVLVGNNFRKTTLTNISAATNATRGLVVKGLYTLKNSNGPLDAASTLRENTLIGLYGEANFSFKDLVFVGVTGRNDWSSTLPVNNRSFFYPSVNGSFVFSQLFGTSSIGNVLNFGKIRASWAKVGNDAAPYQLRSVYLIQDLNSDFGSTVFPFNGAPGFTQSDRIGNDQLTPEFTSSMEIGTELAFLNSRINFDFTYFITNSTNQIINVPIAPTTGFRAKTLNAGEMQNEGVEITLNTTPFKSESGFTLNVYGTFTKVKNTVVSINEEVEQISVNPSGSGASGIIVVATPGKPYGTFYGTAALRDPATGKIVIDAVTGLPQTDPLNRYFGSYLPNYQASLGATLSYKGLSLMVLFDTKQGGQFYSRTRNTMAFVGTSPETTTNERQDYPFPNSVYLGADGKSFVNNTDVNFHPYTFYTGLAGSISDFSLLDASFIKFREASINYSIPSKFLANTPISGLTVGVFGNNLFIWTPKENAFADPEINSQGASNVQGFEFGATPSLRNYGFNVRLSF